MENVFLARQPIFDRDSKVVGYELLYRSEDMDRAVFPDGNKATSVVISNAFMDIGIEKLVGDKLVFLNLTKEYVLGDYTLPPENENVVLEVLEDIDFNQDIVQSIKGLSEKGYQVALDDVVDPNHVKDVLSLADIVKVDLLAVDSSLLRYHVDQYRRHDILILAERSTPSIIF